jgi:hypothetical protein
VVDTDPGRHGLRAPEACSGRRVVDATNICSKGAHMAQPQFIRKVIDSLAKLSKGKGAKPKAAKSNPKATK